MQENNLDLQLTEEEMTRILGAIEVLETLLFPKLTVLGKGEKRDILIMGDKSVAFVDKALEVSKQERTLLGAFIDQEAFEHDVHAIGELRSLHYKVNALSSALNDSYALVGSEAYKTALMVYSLMKNAAKMGHPGAKEKLDELAARFPGRKKPVAAE